MSTETTRIGDDRIREVKTTIREIGRDELLHRKEMLKDEKERAEKELAQAQAGLVRVEAQIALMDRDN